MADDVYFDGDPEHDSRRRHMERVLKGGVPRRRWPWVLAIVGGGAWAAWRMTHPPSLAEEQKRGSGGQVQPSLAEADRRGSGGQGASRPAKAIDPDPDPSKKS